MRKMGTARWNSIVTADLLNQTRATPDPETAAFVAPHHAPRYGRPMSQETRHDTHFGYRQVPLGEKQALVDDVFHKVARRYDLMNDLMSGGLHRAWKDALVTAINPPTKGRPGRLDETKGRPGRLDEKPERNFALLDVAGGTGDVSFRTIRAGGYGTRATVADINADMLGVGRERALAQGLDDAVTFVDANAEGLPF